MQYEDFSGVTLLTGTGRHFCLLVRSLLHIIAVDPVIEALSFCIELGVTLLLRVAVTEAEDLTTCYGCLLHDGRPWLAQAFIALQSFCQGVLGTVPQAGSQCNRIFQRLRRSLAPKWQHGMGRIAKQRQALLAPVLKGVTRIERISHGLVRDRNDLSDLLIPPTEFCGQILD